MATKAAVGPGGKFDFDDGGSYAGDWTDGMAHGYGVCTGPRSEGEFAGAWQQGFETSGVFRAGGGSAAPVYEGQWLQGRRHGLGVDSRGYPGAIQQQNGGPRWIYRGEWTQGFRGRYGVRQSTATGTKYEGTWSAGLQDGYGVETYADGGTYYGQWLRGVRHGYGVRQSVSYEVAVRYPTHTAFANVSIPVPGLAPPPLPEKEDDLLLRERDLRIEESRGGFVLRARTVPGQQDSASGKHRMVLDKYGKPSIRKTIVKELRLIRQRSTGDLLHEPSSRSSSRMSGSVRSTSSQTSYASSIGTTTTGQGSVYSDEGSEASFVSQSDIPVESYSHGLELTERYLGEWKGDRRSGYGIGERSDGLRYEGEWVSNRKHGYGVTTLPNGTRLEGKYKNNILVASSSGSKTSAKLFTLRSGKIQDRVVAAVQAAIKAAEIASQKAEIATARMQSARVKAEQAEEAAKRAASDAEIARQKAKTYSPGASQPGSNIIANRPTEEADMQGELVGGGGAGAMSTYNGFNGQSVQSPAATQSSPTKLFSFFKPKKPSSQLDVYASSNLRQSGSTLTRGGAATPGGTLSSSGGYGNYNQQPTGPGRTASAGPSLYRTPLPSGNEQFEQTSWQQSSAAAPNSIRPQYQQGDYTNQTSYMGGGRDGTMQSAGWTTSARNDQSQTYNGNFQSTNYAAANYVNGLPADGVANGGVMTSSSSTYAHGHGTMSAESRRAALAGGLQRSFDEHGDQRPPAALIDRRRCSLPSIVKQQTDLVTGPGSRVNSNTGGGPSSTSGSHVDSASKSAEKQRPQLETFIIENGVRKRVRSIFDDTSASRVKRTPSVAAAAVAAATTVLTAEAVKSRRKMYTLESPRRPDMGSVPDVSAVSKDEVLPREVVSVLSQRRREELIKQRENDEWRRRNQIVFHFGDIMDWCDRRRMLVFMIAVNISLVSVFYSLLSQ